MICWINYIIILNFSVPIKQTANEKYIDCQVGVTVYLSYNSKCSVLAKNEIPCRRIYFRSIQVKDLIIIYTSAHAALQACLYSFSCETEWYPAPEIINLLLSLTNNTTCVRDESILEKIFLLWKRDKCSCYFSTRRLGKKTFQGIWLLFVLVILSTCNNFHDMFSFLSINCKQVYQLCLLDYW